MFRGLVRVALSRLALSKAQPSISDICAGLRFAVTGSVYANAVVCSVRI